MEGLREGRRVLWWQHCPNSNFASVFPASVARTVDPPTSTGEPNEAEFAGIVACLSGVRKQKKKKKNSISWRTRAPAGKAAEAHQFCVCVQPYMPLVMVMGYRGDLGEPPPRGKLVGHGPWQEFLEPNP